MRHTGNFSLEWGYLAPAPSFLRSVRLVVVAAGIAAAASAAVVFALVRQPAAEASVAVRTLAQPTDVTATARQTATADLSARQSEHVSMPDAEHARGAIRPQDAPAIVHAPDGGSRIAAAPQRAPTAAVSAAAVPVAAAPAPAHSTLETAVAPPEAKRALKTADKKTPMTAKTKDPAAPGGRLHVASAQQVVKQVSQPPGHNVARSNNAPDNNTDVRDDWFLARTMGVTDHVITATQRAVSTIGVIPSWFESIGNRLGGQTAIQFD